MNRRRHCFRLIPVFSFALPCVAVLLLVVPSLTTAQQSVDSAKKSYKLVFNGEDAYVAIPKLRYDGSHPITLEALVTPFPLDQRPVRAAVIGNVEYSGVGISCKPTDWRFNVNDGRDFDIGYAYANSDGPPVADKQVHVAGVFDGKNLTIFVDGKSQVRTGTTQAPHVASSFDFMIGADPDDAGNPQHFFKGAIDEVRVSKVVRYKADFKPSKTKFESDADTLVLYHFDEGSGEEAKDASPNKLDAKIHGTRWVEAPN